MFDMIPFGRGNRSLFNYFDDMERSCLDGFTTQITQFRTDVLDKGDKYILEAELPGFSKEDIQIDVKDNTLTIHAEHRETSETRGEKKGQYIQRERRYGSFSRSFDLSEIKSDEIKAGYSNGILTLSMPKKDPSKAPVSRRIDIE